MSAATLQSLLLLAVIGLPLSAASALTIASWRGAVMRATPVAAVPALLLVFAGHDGASLHLPSLGPHAVLGLDAVGRVFLGFTSVLWLTSGWYARAYLAKDPNPVRFHLFFLLAMAGNFGLILAADVPTFYVCFTLMGLAAAGLVFHRGDAKAARAGRVYLALAMLGEVLIFTGFVFLTVSGDTTRIAELHRGVFSPPALLLLLVGFGIKAGALSLHFWLPLAHPAAPVPASAVLSGAMLKAGLLGWIRFLPLGEAAIPLSGFTLISAGLGAAFLGTFVGVVQKNPKTVLAYSSIGQMGIITTGVGLGALRPEAWSEIQWAVLVYATHHALAKGALFLGVGPAHAARTRWQVVTARVGLLLPALALAGAPFTSGALAKVALKSNVAFLPGGWADALRLLLPLAAVGTALKMARFLWLTWPRHPHPAPERTKGLWPPWLCLVGAVLLGVWLLPGALGVLPAKLTPHKLWLATWPLLGGAGLAMLGAWLRRWFSGDLVRWLPAGDLGVPIERLLARRPLRRRVAHRLHHGDGGGPDPSPAPGGFPWSMGSERTGESLARLESRLYGGPAGGAVWLLLMGLLTWLLAASGG